MSHIIGNIIEIEGCTYVLMPYREYDRLIHKESVKKPKKMSDIIRRDVCGHKECIPMCSMYNNEKCHFRCDGREYDGRVISEFDKTCKLSDKLYIKTILKVSI